MNHTTVAYAKHEYAYSGAVFSQCGTFRYRLWRIWNPERPRVLWIMLNPSTADAANDDPTIRKCAAFAKKWGCGGIEVVNLYAFRTASPALLKASGYRLGVENLATLSAMLQPDGLRFAAVAAWGAHAQNSIAEWVRVEADRAGLPLHYLRLNKGGSPAHPLYLPLDSELTEWRLS